MAGDHVGRVPPTGPLDPTLIPLVRRQPGPGDIPQSGLGTDHAALSSLSGGPRRARLTSLLPDDPLPIGAKAAALAATPAKTAGPSHIQLRLSSQLLPVDPIARNQIITQSYDSITKAFQQYMGGPHLTDWSRLAVEASSEVGVQLRDAKDIRSSMQELIDGRAIDSAAAVRHLYARLHEDGAVSKGIGLVAASAGLHISTVEDLGKAMLGGHSLFGAAKNQSVSAVVDSLTSIEHQLGAGNRAIFLNIAPAYEIFLDAETSTPARDGIAALQQSRFHDDPLIIQAFTNYKAAKQTTDVAQRRQFMQMGNVLIARHEQQNIAQPYIEPIRDELRTVSPTLTYQPPGNGPRLKIFPDGGDWSNVEDRLQAIGRISDTFLAHDMATN